MKLYRYPAKQNINWKLLSALLGVFLAHTASATIPLYKNIDVLNYTIPGIPPPIIDAKAFVNENTFTINFATYNPSTPFYETMNTLFYTNTGTMVANGPNTTNGAVIILGALNQNFGCGYNFDLQNASHQWADTFYNPGTIRCVSATDGNSQLYVLLLAGAQTYLTLLTSYGECLVSATNIINPGVVDVSVNGLMKFNGQNVDLSGGQLTVEPPLNFAGLLAGQFGAVSINSFGTVGLNTNVFWNPNVDLQPNTAVSSYSPFPYIVILTNSTAYIDDQPDPFNANTIVHRSVFIQNNTPNVPYKVYFDPLTTFSLGLELGTVNVEWDGSYTDPASGNLVNNYLYLNNSYVFGATTNNFVLAGVPFSFQFITSPDPLFFNPAAAGFVNEFPNVFMTNRYAYMNGNLTASTAATNVSTLNPHGTITNLPGKIYITASKELNMAYTAIAGPNYMLLNCTNQFDGSPGASIASPYSDIYLGVTNGFMTVSNLLMAAIPNYSGNIQAWSTRWVEVDAFGVTNDYRVMIVFSALQPTTAPWIQNLYLHGTKSLVISDPLNVYGSFYSDARSLTLTTNYVGNGATSLDGELNWLNPAAFNANSAGGTQMMPNLLWLTNNGAIRASGNANFGSGSTVYGAFINHSLIADQGTTVWTTNFLNDGTISNGVGSFTLQSRMALLTSGSLVAGGDVSLGATNSLIISNHMIQAGRKLTLLSTNLTDTGVTNGNTWVVGAAGVGGTIDSGFNIPLMPPVGAGDLLGTTVTNIAPSGKAIFNVWAGTNYGISTRGFTNNLALGRLFLDAKGALLTKAPNYTFNFNGVGVSNALYVDYLELMDSATTGNATNVYNFPWLTINTNMFIYYAQAVKNGISIAEAIDNASQHGANGGRLRWIYSYAGYFSSTNIVYPDGTTNTINAGLAGSSTIDSDGDGTVNSLDPTPVFVPSQVNFTVTTTNLPPLSVKVQWATIPNATNFIYYTTSLLATNWLAFTNFKNYYYGNNVALTNAAHSNNFISPQPYPGPATNVWVYDAITNVPHYYKVVIWPWLNYPH